MNEAFKIYVDRLKDGSKEKISEKYSSEFLGVVEKACAFSAPVIVDGEAYLVGDKLFVSLKATTFVTVPCTICNEMHDVEVFASTTIVEEMSGIKSGIYCFTDALREAILLETPIFAECCGGVCPQRDEIRRYLRDEESKETCNDEGQRPFATILN